MVHGDLQNLLGEHGGLPCVLPSTVHLDLGNHHDAQWYLRLLSKPYTPIQTLIMFYMNNEHGRLPCILPCAVHPDLGHPLDTEG